MAPTPQSAGLKEIPVVWYHDWVEKNVPDQTNRVAIVTGGNSGVGYWCAAALAKKGAHVVLACRSVERGEAAAKDILQMHPKAKVEAMPLDNMSLASVREFAAAFKSKFDRLDLLLNNAGVMAMPAEKSKDGHDIQFQTNHLAHFLLTDLLWDRLVQSISTGPARVVQQSSGAHLFGGFDPDDMDMPPGANCVANMIFKCCGPACFGMAPEGNWRRYAMSKLCNILFGLELHRRIQAAGLGKKVMSVACHPGWASTHLQKKAGEAGGMKDWEKQNNNNAQSAPDGSLPLLMAAVGQCQSGDYIGPSLSSGYKGPPKVVQPGGQGKNAAMARNLWSYSEKVCGSKFEIKKV